MSSLLRLPGLIDVHVHLRDFEEQHKEDFLTGTSAAAAGGITAVCDMPNNLRPVFTVARLAEKIVAARKKAVVDYAFYFGSDGRNAEEFAKAAPLVAGLKIYLNVSTGQFKVENEEILENIFSAWPKQKIIIVHAEGDKVDLALELAAKFGKKLHITHVSTKSDLEKIIEAKKNKVPVTCDTTPNYLFLTDKDYQKMGTLAMMKPPLAKQADQDFLWQHLSDIDCISTDHAPHTLEEKKSAKPPNGVPGLETLLPLLLTALTENRISVKEIIRLTNEGPRKIFGINQGIDTYIEAETEEEYKIENKNLFTKCGWSPYDGWTVKGKVVKTIIRGQTVFENCKILVPPGFGRKVI